MPHFPIYLLTLLLITSSVVAEEKPDTADDQTDKAQKKLDQFELSEVTVVGNTPLGSSGLELKRIPGNVQVVEDEDIHRHEAFSLTDFMNRRLQSVNINDVQNNPYQPDISYRGFSASPVLGTPIGISVYQDGVRVNEAFGDTVNWDLIPQMAIANMEMQPGSNPLYGLNTLGGALAIRTKSGSSHPGFSAQALGGSYGRQQYQAEYGGSKEKWDWYFAGNIFNDAGWRPFSPTTVNQGFGKVGWEDEKTDLDLSFTYAGNAMQGVGPADPAQLQQNWQAINTAPDLTRNTLYFVNLKGNHRFNDYLQLSGNAYNRNNDSFTQNSNTSQCDNPFNQSPNLTQCSYTQYDTNGNLVSTSTITPSYFQNSRARQNGMGVNLQLTSDYKLFKKDNQLIVGGGYNYSLTRFKSSAQAAFFNQTPNGYSETPVSYLDPTVYDPIYQYGPTVDIAGHTRYANIFATDNFSLTKWLHLNASMNWVQSQVFTTDYLNSASDSGYLGNAVHFQRVNPSAGLTFDPFDALSLKNPFKEFTSYFNYSEGMRAPTTVEMACANPTAPCSLPNGFVSDPDLKAVVSHTLEAGVRGRLPNDVRWNVSVYQTTNTNDLMYLNAPNGSPNVGYFSNVGTTRRQGLELGLNGDAFEKLNWYMSYGYIDATYQSTMQLQNALGSESVVAGNKIPSIPQNTFKVGGEYELMHGLYLGSDLQYTGNQYARGDDQNIYGQLSDYTILNLNSRYQLTKQVELFAMGRNVLDTRYYTFGQMGQSFFTGQTTQFVGPSAPATGYAGVRVKW